MDVSHSDHSYIIGKGGFKIQQVMEETGCHIHFPDSNKPKPRVAFPCFKPSIADLRNLTTEKSNQVIPKLVSTMKTERTALEVDKKKPR